MEAKEFNNENNDNVIDLDNQAIIKRDIYEEMVTKAIVTMLTLMKSKNTEIKSTIKANYKKNENNSSLSTLFKELEELEHIYLEFEENLDASVTDPEIKGCTSKMGEFLIRY